MVKSPCWISRSGLNRVQLHGAFRRDGDYVRACNHAHGIDSGVWCFRLGHCMVASSQDSRIHSVFQSNPQLARRHGCSTGILAPLRSPTFCMQSLLLRLIYIGALVQGSNTRPPRSYVGVVEVVCFDDDCEAYLCSRI